MVRLLFSTRNNIGSWLIRFLTWSRWSHVSIIDNDTVIEAVAFHGVREIPLEQALGNASTCEVALMECADPDAVIAMVRAQLGKPYDYLALIGFLIHRDWQDDTDWFCSELIAGGFQQAGVPLYRRDAMHRITQEDIWKRTVLETNSN